MKASEIVNKYALKERNFQGVNLRGLSFKNQDLSGADFSGADIRGTNFSRAILVGANFSRAKAGLQRNLTISLALFSWFLSGFSGVISAFASGYLGFLLVSNNTIQIFAGLATLVGLFVVSIITVRHSLVVALVALAVVSTLAILGALPFAGRGTGSGANSFAFAIVGATIGVFVLALALSGAFAVAKASAFNISGVFAVAGAFTFSMFGRGAVVQARFFALPCAFSLILLSVYTAWRAMKRDPRYAQVRNFAIAFATMGGTSFRKANLTDANFTGAKLKSTDMRAANLTRTCWRNVTKLDQVRPGNSYLQLLPLQEWLVGKGTEKNFDKQDLRGVNLQGANLTEASFIGADLSEANLQGANLAKAKLVQTQLDQTDLTKAILTGAYIEEWNITTDTKLDGIQCDYIYMRLPPDKRPDWLQLSPGDTLGDNPRRKPEDWQRNFEPGEFADFIAPMVATLDLYHNQVVDPRLLAIAYHKLREENPDAALEIATLEKKGEHTNKTLMRLYTSPQADHGDLSAQHFNNLDYLYSLPPETKQALLLERGAMIQMMAGLIGAGQQPQISIENNQQGDKSMSGNEINTNGGNYNEKIGGSYNNIAGDYIENKGTFGIGVNKGNVESGANVSVTINEGQKQNLAEAAAEIKQLLQQLQQDNPGNNTSAQMMVAAQAIQHIEGNPNLKQKVISAVKEGGLAAFERALDNPAGAFVAGAIRGWQEVES